MALTKNGRANGSHPKNFGAVLEGRGDYESARRAFENAGLKDDAKRVEDKIRVVALAARFEESSLPHRAALLLLDNGLEKEATALAERLSNEKWPNALFAKGLVWAKTGQLSRLGPLAEELVGSAAYGQYLLGRIAAKFNYSAARYTADSLCGKPRPPETAPNTSDTAEEAARGLIICGSDPGKAARSMVSLLMWNMTTESEMLYYALRLYQQIGDEAEARKCLVKLHDRARDDHLYDHAHDDHLWMKFYLSGVFALYGKEAVLGVQSEIVPEKHNSVEVLLTMFYAKDGLAGFEELFSAWYDNEPPKNLLDAYNCVIYGESHGDFPLAEFLSNEELVRLIDKRNIVKEKVLAGERAKLADFEAAAADIHDFAGVLKAKEILHSIEFGLLESDHNKGIEARWGREMRLADIASAFADSKEAQVFAGTIFRNRDCIKKALDCARNLLALGAETDADSLIISAANAMQPEDVAALAKELESGHPKISLELYLKAQGKADFIRLAKELLAHGDLDAVEKAAWQISFAWPICKDAKKSLMMREALQRLESFGEEGAKKANGIRMEMTIGHLFTSTELDEAI